MGEEHAHKFVDGGTVYADGANPLPGSGATRRYYGALFFCEACLERRVEALTGIGESSYSAVRFGARPVTDVERSLLLPEHDRKYGRW